MPRSNSPEDGARAILTAAENVTGLVLDEDEIDVFIKEESSSPVPDDDRPMLVARLQPLKFKPAVSTQKVVGGTHVGRTNNAHAAKPRKNGGKAAPPSRGGLRGEQAEGKHIIPRRVEDWEPWKGVLHELYITQNRILRDIIGIMDSKYNVKATPKMYKNQFARWGFFKYAVKKRPRNKGDLSPGQSSNDSSGMELVSSKGALMHDSEGSRGVQVGLTAVRRFLHGHIDMDSANLKAEEVTGFVDPCYRYFKVAMDLFDLKENIEGGRVLRLAFLQIERKIAKPTMKSFSDLCFLVPHLLLESGRRDILGAYLRYLSRLATVKFGKHPIAELAASLASMADRPEDLMRFIKILAQVNSDTVSSLPGMLDRNRVWARNQYLACQRSKMLLPPAASPTDPDPEPLPLSTGSAHDHQMIRLEAQSVYWAQKLVMQDPVADNLAEQWLRRRFEDGYDARVEAQLARLKERVESGQFPHVFARMMECLMIGWLSDYYETVGDWERAFEWGRRGLELSADEQYALWSIHLEDLMRRHGKAAEADELKRRRRADAWLEKVRNEVDKLTIG
ncbi:hypothetical protein VTK26DRAFT_3673 [Humicola hyalothermophila]